LPEDILLRVSCEDTKGDVLSELGSLAGTVDVVESESAIYIKPASKFVMNAQDHNYCYFGAESGWSSIQKGLISIGIMIAEGAVEALVGAACIGSAGLGCVVGVALLPGVFFATGATEAWLYTQVDKNYYWPDNPDIKNR
jgi:hypothetical protein